MRGQKHTITKFGAAARSFLRWRLELMQCMDAAHDELTVLHLPASERHTLGRVGINDPLW